MFQAQVKLNPASLEAGELAIWPDINEPESYRGLTNAKQMDFAKGTVIVIHGNAGSAIHRAYFIHALQPLGLSGYCWLSIAAMVHEMANPAKQFS